METFTAPKARVDNPHFASQRLSCLANIDWAMLDPGMTIETADIDGFLEALEAVLNAADQGVSLTGEP